MGSIQTHDGARNRVNQEKIMETFANILFVSGLLMGIGCCFLVAAAIMAMVLLDD
jgi:hypothetical protein